MARTASSDGLLAQVLELVRADLGALEVLSSEHDGCFELLLLLVEERVGGRGGGRKGEWEEGWVGGRVSGRKGEWEEGGVGGRGSGRKGEWEEGGVGGTVSGRKGEWEEG